MRLLLSWGVVLKETWAAEAGSGRW
jgi:hypothetical protein